MKLQVPFVQLPLLFDAGALAAEVDALPESAWLPHPQGFAGNSMLPAQPPAVRMKFRNRLCTPESGAPCQA